MTLILWALEKRPSLISVRAWTSSTHQTGPALQSPTAVFIEMISKCDIDETPGSTPDVVVGQQIHKSRLRGGEEEQAAALSSNSCCAAHTMNVLRRGNRRVILKQKDDIYIFFFKVVLEI